MSEHDVQLIVTVRVYDGTTDEAIEALTHAGFDLAAGGEAEILTVAAAADGTTPDGPR